MLAVAGVLGAISLAGIFVVYLVNTIGDNNDGQTTAAVATPGTTGASGATGAASANGTGANGASGSSPPATATPPAAAGKTGSTPPAAAGGTAAGPGLNVIPRNQVYTTFTNKQSGYAIRYPKGWVQQGSGADLRFTHNNDFIRIAIFPGTVPSIKDFRTILRKNTAVRLPASAGNPGTTTMNGAPGVHATVIQKAVLQQTPQGAIRLVTDLYRFGGKKGKFAAIDMGTPDRVRPRNLDDYKKILKSFRWR